MSDEQDNILEKQIGNIGAEEPAQSGLGKLSHMPGSQPELTDEEQQSLSNFKNKMAQMRVSYKSSDIQDGWIPVDRSLFGIRSQFYPADWEFRIKPATVEAIKNWSSIDEENIATTNSVFNEIIKSCVSIVTPNGNIPAFRLNSWDRFFMILLVREHTFAQGEQTIRYEEECDMCGHELVYTLNSKDLFYEFPDDSVIDRHWNAEERCWIINPRDYDVNGYSTIRLYVPTLEKDEAIIRWAYNQAQHEKVPQEAFVKFLPWLLDRAPKDPTLLDKKIKECRSVFRSWDTNMFVFMEEVLRNVTINPSERLVQKCPNCGEEVSAAVRFPDGIGSLFIVQGGHRKFGTK